MEDVIKKLKKSRTDTNRPFFKKKIETLQELKEETKYYLEYYNINSLGRTLLNTIFLLGLSTWLVSFSKKAFEFIIIYHLLLLTQKTVQHIKLFKKIDSRLLQLEDETLHLIDTLTTLEDQIRSLKHDKAEEE